MDEIVHDHEPPEDDDDEGHNKDCNKDVKDEDSHVDAPPSWGGELAEAVEDIDKDTEVVVPGDWSCVTVTLRKSYYEGK